jgi:ABC transporter transmembrane region.
MTLRGLADDDMQNSTVYYESLCFKCGEYQIPVSVIAICHLYCDRLSQPLFLGGLVRYFSESNSDNSITVEEAYIYAAGVVLCSGLNVFAVHPYMMGIIHIGMKIRVACCSLIYRKVIHSINSW